MKKALDILKNKGIRPTQQRLAVYKALNSPDRHLTAEEIYGKIKTLNPALSLATVYTILDILKSKGLVSEIRIHFDRSCFETRLDIHHHFLCSQCKSIFDIDMEVCQGLKNKEVQGHRIEAMQGYFYGVCRRCRKV
jgi:Fur family transcriptional regulator, peroxide stress response regulator